MFSGKTEESPLCEITFFVWTWLVGTEFSLWGRANIVINILKFLNWISNKEYSDFWWVLNDMLKQKKWVFSVSDHRNNIFNKLGSHINLYKIYFGCLGTWSNNKLSKNKLLSRVFCPFYAALWHETEEG